MKIIYNIWSFMSSTSWIAIFLSLLASSLVLGYGLQTLKVSNKNIFPGSGAPHKMASMILSSTYLMAKYLVGIFIIASILILLGEKVISTEQGLPVLTLIVGYLLGNNSNISSKSSDEKSQ